MEKILKEILKELKYQTQLMENLYERKDAHQAQMHDVHESMDTLKKEFAKHPILMQGEMGKIMGNLFKTMGGKK